MHDLPRGQVACCEVVKFLSTGPASARAEGSKLTRPHLLRSLELFTGAGGLALGTHVAGFRHLALVERDRYACETLRENACRESLRGIGTWRIVEEDTRSLQFGVLGGPDLVAGGPPCQPFSVGGKHRGRTDDRDMIPEFVRAIRETKPKAFIFENVRGLTRPAFRSYFSYVQLQLTHPTVTRKSGDSWEEHLAVLEDLHTSGNEEYPRYNVVTRVLNAADFGVPQQRARVFIVGFRSDLAVDWHFPPASHSLERLLYDQWVSGEYWERHGVSSPEQPPPRWRRRVDRLGRLAPPPGLAWSTVRDAIRDLPSPKKGGPSASVPNHVLQLGARVYKGHTGSPLDLPSKALKAGVHGVPGGENMLVREDGSVRYFTVREAARVQTFPDEWHFRGAWSEAMRQLGNAVPVRLAESIGTSVFGRLRTLHA